MQNKVAPAIHALFTAPLASGPGIDEYPVLDTLEPHIARREELLRRHPELRGLMGPAPISALGERREREQGGHPRARAQGSPRVCHHPASSRRHAQANRASPSASPLTRRKAGA
jgi:hypothetical protein